MIIEELVASAARFAVSDDGATAIEYAFLASLIGLVTITAMASIGTNLASTFGGAATALT
jgi:Flp pilus assembly pilin Flp